ncbi:hypothetical protein DPMN_186917 [Dreissena polymorpha]|uniref:Uncharacterized protein n=1 Tax=Dreissena polymorpha TaxID=45954 RepID=A0A9D4DN20_DREPO|nr:hypothetical protein DPMN_186917 [Dreissena polymorpha]
MTCLGYGPHIRQKRREAYNELARLTTALACGNAMWITTGSKAEGLTCFLESDRDSIVVINGIICLEEGVDSIILPADINIFRSCSRMSYPGHCILLLERYGSSIPIRVVNALCDDGYGRKFLSSDLFVNEWLTRRHRQCEVQLERAGPSTPTSYHGGKLREDLVHALHFNCPSILTRWASRHRHWPTPNVVKEVVSLGALVTPVGMKGSDYEHVEWRICFNSGENVLVKNLSDTQVKLYVLLKMVKTDILKPRKKEITSFTMKNIVLWIAENNPQSLFEARSLFHWLHKGLDALRVAIDKKELPYYMISERNLMASCDLEYEQRLTWITSINEMMKEGPRIILRLPKIRRAIIANPEPLRWYSSRKIEMEMLQFILMNRVTRGMNRQTDVILQESMKRQEEICLEVTQRMIREGARLNYIINVWDNLLM